MNGVVELRQYTLKPGQRDALIALFEREFVESQEAEGMDIIGTFRDLDRPDRFVWLRGFPDMESRKASLAAFYGGAVWKAHRNAANDTMTDSDNVLLLKPAWPGSGLAEGQRAPSGAAAGSQGTLKATIHHFENAVPESFVSAFHALAAEQLRHKVLAAFVTDASANTFPALPVRAGGYVFIRFTHDHGEADTSPVQPEGGTEIVKTEVLRLKPTARSRVH